MNEYERGRWGSLFLILAMFVVVMFVSQCTEAQGRKPPQVSCRGDTRGVVRCEVRYVFPIVPRFELYDSENKIVEVKRGLVVYLHQLRGKEWHRLVIVMKDKANDQTLSMMVKRGAGRKVLFKEDK